MSSPLQIAGTVEPIESDFHLVISQSGTEYDRTWTGTLDATLNKIGALLSEGVSNVAVSKSANSALARITARYNSAPWVTGRNRGNVEETLTVQFNDTPIELHRHPHFINITSERIKILDDAAAKNDSGSVSQSDPAELAYWTYKLRGVNTYKAKLPIITYTRTGGPGMGEFLALADTGKIFNKAQVTLLVSKPVAFAIPDAPIGIVASSNGTFVVGWQLTTQLDYMANGNIQLIETYEYGLWEMAADAGDGFNLYALA